MKNFKYLLAFLGFIFAFAATYYAVKLTTNKEIENSLNTEVNIPAQNDQNSQSEQVAKPTEPKIKSKYEDENINTIALLGVDRRNRDEAFRTDIMIVVSINKETNRVVMASVPRDLWWKNGRINATYIQSGWEDLQQGLTEITGYKPEKFVLTDFADFKWLVDSMGGVPVNIQTTFTDSQYPVDATFEYQTVSFTQGTEKLTGERALIFSRSRKGDNDNGDWGRMKRQHLILNGMLTAITQPQSIFKDMDPVEILKVVTTNKMDTNLEPADAIYAWDLYKDKDKYKVTSLFLDYEHVFTPPMEEYGGAWVLAPINGTYEPFKTKFKNALMGIEIEQASADQENTAKSNTVQAPETKETKDTNQTPAE